MKSAQESERGSVLKAIPSVDQVLGTETAAAFAEEFGRAAAVRVARDVIGEFRDELEAGALEDVDRETLAFNIEERFKEALEGERRSALRRVINATGVIIHTNLGRAPLSAGAMKAIEQASGYCPLEYDLETGRRGRRGSRAEALIAEITGAEEAVIVNNCAAAAVLVLSSLCEGKEAVISRGELVEIGGDFRVPDVMERAGASLVEVGTTNRTRTSDYENAITENTGLFLKVHPSNYRIVGFTSVPTVGELAEAAHSKGLLLYEDAGSGALVDLTQFGLGDEPLIAESIAAGADVVTFSGDKLVGSVQAGFIVGKAGPLSRIRTNPLYRAMRPSKIIYAALEATLASFRTGSMFEEVPVLRMLSQSRESLELRTRELAAALNDRVDEGVSVEVKDGASVVGGGSAPGTHPPGSLIFIRSAKAGANEIEAALRGSDPPVIARIENDAVVIDLRTVEESDLAELAVLIPEALG